MRCSRNFLLARAPDITALPTAFQSRNVGWAMTKMTTKMKMATKTHTKTKKKTKTITTTTTIIIEQEVSAKLNYDQLHALASALNISSSDSEITAAPKSLVQEKAGPIAQDRATTGTAGIRLKPLRRQLATTDQKLGPDEALGLARRVLAVHFKDGAHILRCADGSYWEYNGTHWIEKTANAISQLIFNEANKAASDAVKPKRLINDAKSLFDHLIGADDDAMGFNNEPSPIVNCANGEIWIDQNGKAELRPHRPESRLTYCLPVSFKLGAACPMFDKALLQIFGNAHDPADMARHWNEFVGYAIQPRRDIASFWLLIGHGSNGKTKLLETMQALVGPQAVLNDQIAKFEQDRFNIAALTGKLLFIDDDIAANTRLNDGLLKKISEVKKMSARHAHGRRKYNFRCHALPIMAGNNYPTTLDTSYGLRRRAMVIPFDKKFGSGEADPQLFSKIWAGEMPGILNRALEGLKRLRERGRFLPPVDCENAAHEFMAHANPLVGFIDDQCEREPDAHTPLDQFRTAMKSWTNSQGFKGVVPIRALGRQLEGLDYTVGKHKGSHCIYGLRLKEPPGGDD